MTDPMTDEAVEAAARAIYAEMRAFPVGTVGDDHHRDMARALAARALTAAAPHITAQATADDPRKVAHIQCDCVPDLGPSHCHLCSERAGREMSWTEAHPDLRAGIEALRDELASAEPDVDQSARVVSRHVRDCLDALLRGAANV